MVAVSLRSDEDKFITIALNSNLVNSLKAFSGREFAIGGSASTLNLLANDDEGFFSRSSGNPSKNIQLIVQTLDNPTSLISINDVSLNEGNFDNTSANFTVSLTSPSVLPISVRYSTQNLTAMADSDYLPQSGVINFNPGEFQKVVSIPVIGDFKPELNETFAVNLFGSSNAVISKAQGRATIVNDDLITGPSLSINNVSLTEGNDGTKLATFRVNLSVASADKVQVSFITNNGTAVAGQDYLTQGGTLVFNPGQTEKSVSVPVIGDRLRETNEFFALDLFNSFNATLGKSRGIATIANDDFLKRSTDNYAFPSVGAEIMG